MRTIITAAAMLVALPAVAAEQPVALKDAPGRDVVESNCGACHSLDYIEMNAYFLDRAAWERTVTKMVKVMGAPIADADMPAILDYLAANYGKEPQVAGGGKK